MRAEVKKENTGVRWWNRALMVMFMDIIIVVGSYLMALFLRFDFVFSNIPTNYLEGYICAMPYWCVVTVIVFYGFYLYHSIWHFVGISELNKLVQAYIVLIPCYVAGALYMKLRMPLSWYLMGYLMTFVFHGALRFTYRFLRNILNQNRQRYGEEVTDRIMIIGAGEAGRVLVKELINTRHLNTKVCCAIDDNPNKKGKLLEGLNWKTDFQFAKVNLCS